MDKVKIGGEDRPVKYNFNAIEELDDLGFDVLNGTGKFKSIKFIKSIAYVGLKYGADETGKTCAFTIGQVGSWLDNETVPKFLSILNKQAEGASKEDNLGE